MDNFIGCTITAALVTAFVVAWSGVIYASYHLGAWVFG